MTEGAEEPDWVKHDRELESETEEALADLDAVVSGERPDLCEWCGFDHAQVKRTGERPDAIPDAALNAAVDALLVDSGLPQYGPHRATVERRQRLAFDAALPFLRAAQPEAGSEEGERELRLAAETLHNIHRGSVGVTLADCSREDCRRRATVLARAANSEAGSEEGERRAGRAALDVCADLLDVVERHGDELEIHSDDPIIGFARAALRAAHPEADRAPEEAGA